MYYSLPEFKSLNLLVKSAIYYLSNCPSIILCFNSSYRTITSRVWCTLSNYVIRLFFSLPKFSPSISADRLILLGSSNYILIDTFSSFICFNLLFKTETSIFLTSNYFYKSSIVCFSDDWFCIYSFIFVSVFESLSTKLVYVS